MFGRNRETYKYEINDGCARLVRYFGKDETLELPDCFEGAKLTEIGDDAFYDCKRLASVKLPEGVTRIGENAFKACASLESVVLPEGLKTLGEYAFSGCRELKRINLPESLEAIPAGCFQKCRALEKLSAGGNISEIGEEAFAGCGALKFLSLGESVKKLAPDALKGAGDKLCLVIPGALNEPDEKITNACDRIYRRGERGPELEVYAGHETKISLEDEVNGEYVTAIGEKVFAMFAFLEQIKLPSRLEYIGENAFAGCSGLNGIEFPPTLKIIGAGAFAGCGCIDKDGASGLRKLVFPAALEEIRDRAFAGCAALENVTFAGENTYIGAGAFALCGFREFSFPGNVTELQSEVLRGCTRLEKVGLPESVDSIWERAFEGCASLSGIKLPDALELIGEGAFSSMLSLKSVRLPAKLREIGKEAFAFDPALESIEVEEENERYFVENGCLVDKAEKALIAAPALLKGELKLSDKIERVGACAFTLSALDRLVLPESVKKIDDWAFRGCKIKELVIENPDAETGSGVLLEAGEINVIASDAVFAALEGEEE